MALSGRLQEFGVAEALGLVARQEKTGYLEIESRGFKVILHFERGRYIQAREPVPDLDDSFIRFIRELRLASPEQWRELAEWQRANPDRDPVEGLIALGVATRDEFRDWLTMHSQGIIDRLMELSEGTFRFEPTLTSPRFGAPLAEKTEFMIMESGRRNDESQEMLSQRLPPDAIPSMRPRRRPTPSDPLQAALLRLVDGTKTVREILGATTIPTHDMLSMLLELVDNGATLVRIPMRDRLDGEARSSGPSLGARTFVLATTAALIVASVYVGFRLWSGGTSGAP